MEREKHLPGLAQWFELGDAETVDKSVRIISDLKVDEVRTFFSWADWEKPAGKEWFDHVFNKMGKESGARILPCLIFTPPEKARKDSEGRALTSYPPKDVSEYVNFVDTIIKNYGNYFDWVQVWDQPNSSNYWDERLDPDWKIYAELALRSAEAIHDGDKKAITGGLAPLEPQWLMRMHENRVMDKSDAFAFNQLTGGSQSARRWFGWETET